MNWYLYIVRCKDNSLYTGITKDLERRISEHNSNNSKGAKSLRSKRPVKLVYFEKFESHKEAARREYAIKHWRREFKLKLIEKFS